MRFKILFLLLLVSLSGLNAISVSWAPSVSFSIGWEGDDFIDELDSSGSFASSAFAEARITAISMKLGDKHNIALPFTLSAVSPAKLSARTEKQRETGYGLEAEYSIELSQWLGLSVGGGFRAHYYKYPGAWYISYGGTITPIASLRDNMSVIVPVSVYGGQNGWYVRAGAGIKLTWEAK